MVHPEVAVGCPAVAQSPSIRKALGQCYWPVVTQTNVSTNYDICWMTIVFGQMVLSMMNELQPRGPQRPQLTRTDHLETVASYHAISMRNALYFPIVEECSTSFGVLHEALHCLPDIPLAFFSWNTLHLLEAL